MLQFLIAAKWGVAQEYGEPQRRDDQDCEDLFASLGFQDDSILTAEEFEAAFENDLPLKRAAWRVGPRPANRVRQRESVCRAPHFSFFYSSVEVTLTPFSLLRMVIFR